MSGDADRHFLQHLSCHITLTCFIFMLTDGLINCTCSGSLDSVWNTFPLVISGGHIFLPTHGMLQAHIDGHFLLHLLCSHYLDLFYLDGYGLINKLFLSQVAYLLIASSCNYLLLIILLEHVPVYYAFYYFFVHAQSGLMGGWHSDTFRQYLCFP